jgi:hypothetical protein
VVTIEPGTRLVLRTAHRAILVRALGAGALSGQWSLPVMAATVAWEPVRGELDLPTGAGSAVLEAELARVDAGMVLRAPPERAGDGARPAARHDRGPHRVQRRAHARAVVEVPVRAGLLDGEATEPDEEVRVMTGRTLSVAGGGLALRWDEPQHLLPGFRLYLELAPESGRLLPAVVQVVTAAANHRHVRVRFLDIAPADVERLVRLVFVAQRTEIASRRR